jgi:hypothetical protein
MSSENITAVYNKFRVYWVVTPCPLIAAHTHFEKKMDFMTMIEELAPQALH